MSNDNPTWMRDWPTNSRGIPWEIHCNQPFQMLLHELAAQDVGRHVRLRNGSICQITAYRKKAKDGLHFELTSKQGKRKIYCRPDGLGGSQNWSFGLKIRGEDVVSFYTESEEIQVVVADSPDISRLLDKLMVQQKLELDLLK